MFDLDMSKLTEEQKKMVALWEEHLAAEFKDKNASKSCDTMVEQPYVNHVPVMTGGNGRQQLEHFYACYFIPQMPEDIELVPISRTVGYNRIVDEFVFRCTHTVQMDWLLPGVAPTGKKLELVKVVIINFQDGKMISEHIHWDQGTALVQLGLIDAEHLPVAGAETARKMIDRDSVSSNLMMKKFVDDDRL